MFLVLLSRKDGAALDQCHADGATHFRVSPFSEQQFVKAMQFAARHAERVAGGYRRRTGDEGQERQGSWRWEAGSRTIELSPALARKAGLGEDHGRRISLLALFRKLDPEGRSAARRAVARLMETGESTAFAHEDSEGAGIAHHLRAGNEGREIIGHTETIAGIDAGGFQSREPTHGRAEGWESEGQY